MKKVLLFGSVVVITFINSIAMGGNPEKFVTNSLGMKFVRIEPGSFLMGVEGRIPTDGLERDKPAKKVGQATEPAFWEGFRSGLIGAVINDGDPIDNRVLKVSRQIDLNWDTAEAHEAQITGKSARWRGLVKSPASGKVTFSLEANDKAVLVVGHERLVETAGKGQSGSGEIEMNKGKLVSVSVDTERTVYTRLYWSFEGQQKVIVPSEAFSYSATEENMAKIFLNWIPSARKKGRGRSGSTGGDYDEAPRHKVTITKAFYISQTEVTISQFRQFKAEYPGYDEFIPYASAISWDEAAAFCEWLSKREGKAYRLPTEAEWEYVCRAGTYTPFSSGLYPPEHETANAWGVKNMHTGVREWCQDWYAVYPEEAQVDPVGPAGGWAKIVRGGNMDWTTEESPYYTRSANRSAVPPAFGPPPLEYQLKQLQNAKLTFNLPEQMMEESRRSYKIERLDDTNVTLSEALNTPFRFTGLAGRWSIRTSGFIAGRHKIGFRVVMADAPKSNPSRFIPPFVHRCVKQTSPQLSQGPDLSKPYYHTRLLYPNFSGAPLTDAWQLGIEQGYGGGHHNSALEVLPNGDLIAGYYNTIFGGERSPCVSIMSMRFRRGADEWDMPSSWPDNVDSDDEGPVYWNDNGRLWLFWGSPRQFAGYPFQYATSDDNGATWSRIHFPLFDKRVAPYAAQPINSALRDSKGTVYIAVDGSHSPLTSELFATKDEGKTWYDTGGRTYGRHSTFIALDDDTIMAFGGKQASIDGFHPINISTDGGRTYTVTPSTLPALGGGTRASLRKLKSGRLLYVGDMQLRDYHKLTPQQAPPGFSGDGAYAALSDDKGKTWRVRKLTGGNVPGKDGKPVKVHTVSYVTARQGPDGIIHIVTSHNNPDLHFELNEAWILQNPDDRTPPVGREDTKIMPRTVKSYSEKYANGRIKVKWSAGVGENGKYLLDGSETWYYEDGQKQWQIEFNAGKRVGTEIYWRPDGTKQWQKVHAGYGTYYEWTNWKPDGKIRARSLWRGEVLLEYDITAGAVDAGSKSGVAALSDGMRILCFGDSITQGAGAELQGGFRGPLKKLLTEAGVKCDFVGRSKTSGLEDGEHEGNGGRRMSKLTATEVPEMFKANPNPDIIILLLGINDLIENRNSVEAMLGRMSALLYQCSRNAPGARILVGNLVPNACDNPVLGYNPSATYVGSEDKVLQFNAQMPRIVELTKTFGMKIELVDLHSKLTRQDLSDGIHPNKDGYDKIAAAWFEAIMKRQTKR